MLPIDVPAPVLGFLAVHSALRAEAAGIEALAGAGDDAQARRRAKLLAQVLGHHHRAEDDLLWPALTERAPHLAGALEALEADHHDLDHLLARLPAALGTAGAVRARLDEHLAAEERDALPVWLATFSPAEHARFGAALQRHTPPAGTGLMIAWLLDHTPPEARELAGVHIPRPLLAAHDLWWGPRYRRRFGTCAPAPAPMAMPLLPFPALTAA